MELVIVTAQEPVPGYAIDPEKELTTIIWLNEHSIQRYP